MISHDNISPWSLLQVGPTLPDQILLGQDGARAQPGLATEAKGKGRMGKGFDMKVPSRLGSWDPGPWNLPWDFCRKIMGGNWKFGEWVHIHWMEPAAGYLPAIKKQEIAWFVPVFSHHQDLPSGIIGTYWNVLELFPIGNHSSTDCNYLIDWAGRCEGCQGKRPRKRLGFEVSQPVSGRALKTGCDSGKTSGLLWELFIHRWKDYSINM